MARKRAFAAFLAIISWGTLVLQFALIVRATVANGGGLSAAVIAYFGYFTILTNILVAMAVTIPVMFPSSGVAKFFLSSGPATGVAAAILLVGIGYHLLLRDVWNPQGPQLVADLSLHYATPALYTLYWAWTIPKETLSWRDIPAWCAYPVGYFAYALARGELIGEYPYPFVDVRVLEYAVAIRNALIILIGYIVLCALLVITAKRIGPHAAPSAALG